MKKHILLSFFFLIVTILFCYSQTEQENLNKYFAYRNWFKTRFIKIGPLAGESLPIENRTIEPMQGYYFLAGSFSISIGQAGL